MPRHTVAAFLNLPDSFNGRTLAVLLLASLVLSITTIIIGPVVPVVGFYQLFVLASIAPLALIHHISVFWLLYKHRDETLKTSLVSESLARKTNIGFMVLFEATWLAGTGLGFSWFGLGYPPTDMTTNKALAMASNVVGLAECLVFLAIIVFCIRARNEISRAARELALTFPAASQA